MENSVEYIQQKPEATSTVNQASLKKAIEQGKSAIADGKTKVEVVRLMYPFIINESPEVIWAAFVEGAGLTEKGAITYWYNVRREHKKGKLKIPVTTRHDSL